MKTPASERHRSIAQVNRMIRSIIEAETLEQFFWVGGRIDRFFKSDRGHVYFDLVDDRARIRCMIREERAGAFPFELRNHLDIEVYGDIHFFEDRAEAQINVIDLRLTDETENARPAVERLRDKELFPARKSKPPTEIRRIGIITSKGSRAIGDFESAYQSAGERRVLAPYVWKFVILEGGRAVQSIVDAILALDDNREIDLIAIIRGGGRSENLAVFETFEIAEALIRCNTYVVTGIGHHRDSTLADDVADYAASTPTAAAHYLAELCLRERPEKALSAPRRQAYGTAAGASRASTVLIVILLILAVASVVYFVALLVAQIQ